ncbi:MAG TPA: hypothetical protein VH475_17895 [Tepidisphaeraceae bacterium]
MDGFLYRKDEAGANVLYIYDGAWQTKYMHLANHDLIIDPATSQPVVVGNAPFHVLRGTQIGFADSTGNFAKKNHLHFEFRAGATPATDPPCSGSCGCVNWSYPITDFAQSYPGLAAETTVCPPSTPTPPPKSGGCSSDQIKCKGKCCSAPDNAIPTCTNGACGFACNPGYADCDGNAANGCETALGTDANCGHCGDTCVEDDNQCNSVSCNPFFGECRPIAVSDGTLCTINGGPGTCQNGTCAPSGGSILTDDFDDGVIDPAKWTVGHFGFGSSVEETNGELQITIAADASESPDTPGVLGSWVTSTCRLRGDFDVQVDYRLADWPPASSVPAVLAADPPGAPQVMYAARIGQDPVGGQAPYEAYFSNIRDHPGGPAYYIPTGDLSGSLRLVRSGDNAVGYYRDTGSGQWVAMNNVQSGTLITPGDASVSLWALPASGHFGHQLTRVAFDNFVVNLGQLVCSGGTSFAAQETVSEPEPTATSRPRRAPEPSSTATATKEPTATPSDTPTSVPTATVTPEATSTDTPTPEPTATVTPAPTETSTGTPTPEPAPTEHRPPSRRRGRSCWAGTRQNREPDEK